MAKPSFCFIIAQGIFTVRGLSQELGRSVAFPDVLQIPDTGTGDRTSAIACPLSKNAIKAVPGNSSRTKTESHHHRTYTVQSLIFR